MSLLLGRADGRLILPGDEKLAVVSGLDRGFAGHAFHHDEYAKAARIAKELGATMALTYLAATYANNMLGQITTTGLYMSIHTASPGNTGANEIVGGTGYTGTRPAITWGAAASGVVVSNNTQTFAMLVTEAGGIPDFGIWTATSGGTYIFGGPTTGLSGSIPSGANVVFTNGITLTQAG